MGDLVQRERHKNCGEIEVVLPAPKTCNISETVQDSKVTIMD